MLCNHGTDVCCVHSPRQDLYSESLRRSELIAAVERALVDMASNDGAGHSPDPEPDTGNAPTDQDGLPESISEAATTDNASSNNPSNTGTSTSSNNGTSTDPHNHGASITNNEAHDNNTAQTPPDASNNSHFSDEWMNNLYAGTGPGDDEDSLDEDAPLSVAASDDEESSDTDSELDD